MASATPTLQEQYDALCEAINTGARTVEYADRRVTYRTLDDMLRIKNSLADQLGLTDAGQPKSPRTSRLIFDRDT